MLPQRYAFDLIRFDPHRPDRNHPAGALRTLLAGVPTRDCHGWGELDAADRAIEQAVSSRYRP
jgi:hypothetical protein